MLVPLSGALLFATASAGAQDKKTCVDRAEQGQGERHAGDLVAARASFGRCVAESCPEPIRQDCTRWLDEVEAELPTISIHAKDARGHDVIGARVVVDGVAVAERLTGAVVHVNPGEHRLRLETPSGASTEQRILVATGQKARVVEMTFATALDVEGRGDGTSTAASSVPPAGEPAPERPSLVLPLVLGGVAVAGLGLGTFFELTGQSEYRDLRDGCGRTGACSSDDVDANRTKLHVIAPVTFAVGAVALVVGGVLLFRALDAGSASPQRARDLATRGAFAF